MRLFISFEFFTIIVFSLGFTLGCSSNKAKVIDTNLEKTKNLNSSTVLGVDSSDEMILKKKINLTEELRRLRETTLDLEDRVYGNRKFQSTGLHGKYIQCLNSLPAEKQKQLPPAGEPDRWSDGNDEFKIGYNANKDELIALKEDKLTEYLKNLKERSTLLQKKEDLFTDVLLKCKNLNEKPKANE